MRSRLPDVAFTALCVVAFVGLLWLSSNMTFSADEWGFIRVADDWSVDRLMQPHIEHWALGLRLMWNSLMATVGMSSYVPYLAVALVFHVATAAGIYTYARRQGHALIALAVGTLFLFLGSGALDLSMGFQMGWNAAAACGTWALVILLREPRPQRAWLAAVLFVVGVITFSSIGLLFVAAAAAVLVLSPNRRRYLWVVVPALVTYGAWFITYGHGSVHATPTLVAIQRFVIDGIANATGQVSGLGAEVGLVIAVLFAVAALVNLLRRERLRLGLIAGSVGLAVQWLLIAYARAAGHPGGYAASRYVYISAIFILIALIGLVAYRRWLRRGNRLPFLVGVLAVFAVAFAWNLDQMRISDGHQQRRTDDHRAAIMLLTEFDGTPAFPSDRSFTNAERGLLRPAAPGEPGRIPAAPLLRELIARYGSPLDDPLALRSTEFPDRTIDRLFAQSVAESLDVGPGQLPDDPTPITLERVRGATAVEAGDCLAIETTGRSPLLDMAVPSASSLFISSENDSFAQVSVSLRGTYPVPGPTRELVVGEVTRLGFPDIGPDGSVGVRLDLPTQASFLLCLESP